MSERRLLARLIPVALLFGLLAAPLVKLDAGDSPVWNEARDHLPVELAIVGDSRAHVGLSPTRMTTALAEAGITTHAYNFAVDGTDVLHQFDFVDRGLAAQPSERRPRVILWAPNPLGFNDNRTNNRLQQLSRIDIATLLRARAPTELVLDLLTLRYFPPYRRRPVIGEKIATYVEIAGKKTLPLQRRVLGLSYDEPPKSREYRSLPDGHEPFTVLDWQDRFERGEKGYQADYAGLGKSDWHLRIARALLARAHAAGILVVVVELPVAPWFREHMGADPRHLAWREALKNAVRDEGGLYWDHTARFDDDRAFGDPAHMADELAFRYSDELGTALAHDPVVAAALQGGR